MIPPSFDYVAPKTLPEAVALLGQYADAKVLAGGHSLIPLMRFRLASPAVLVDINRIDGLSYIREGDGWLKIGAMTREAELERSALITEKYPLLSDTTRMVADPLVRNMATLGGNLAHADPANDHPAAMLAYGAQLVATGPNGQRTIPIAEFFTGPFTTTLESNEILTEIRIPAHKPGDGGCYLKVERKVGDYATAAVAVQVALDGNGKCASIGIGLTNVGLTPIEAAAAEEALRGQSPDDDHIREVARLASEAAEPESDQRGSAEYKRALVKTLTARALRKAVERAKGV
jgi:carbon-monoxide dehydrogenase medium subunit